MQTSHPPFFLQGIQEIFTFHHPSPCPVFTNSLLVKELKRNTIFILFIKILCLNWKLKTFLERGKDHWDIDDGNRKKKIQTNFSFSFIHIQWIFHVGFVKKIQIDYSSSYSINLRLFVCHSLRMAEKTIPPCCGTGCCCAQQQPHGTFALRDISQSIFPQHT